MPGDAVTALNSSHQRYCTLVWGLEGRGADQYQALHDVVARIELRQGREDLAVAAFDLRGPRRHHGSERAVAAAAMAALTGAGASGVAAGVGSGRLVSWAACVEARRRGDIVVIAPRDTLAIRSRLPVSILADPGGPVAVPRATLEVVERLGLSNLAAVATVSAGEMTERFGAVGRRIWDVAMGHEDQIASAGSPAAPIIVHRHLDTAIDRLEDLLALARELAEELGHRLARRGEIVTALGVVMETDHGERIERVWIHGEGLGVSAMLDRIRWGIQGWQAGPVVRMSLAAEQVVAATGHQPDWWGGRAESDRRAEEAVARVAGLLGVGSVTRARWQGGRDPVLAYRRTIPDASEGLVAPALDQPVALEVPRRESLTAPWPGALPAPSPAVVDDPARQIRLLDADGAVVVVSGRGEVSGAPVRMLIEGEPERRIAFWCGPWPIEERWWRPRDRRRLARLQILTADGEAFLVHVEGGAWWLRGRYR